MERTQQENHVLVAKLRRLQELFVQTTSSQSKMIQEQDAQILRLIRANESLTRELRIATEAATARETREGGVQ